MTPGLQPGTPGSYKPDGSKWSLGHSGITWTDSNGGSDRFSANDAKPFVFLGASRVLGYSTTELYLAQICK